MAVQQPVMTGLGAAFIGAFVCGIAGMVVFEAVFTAFPLGNEKDRAVIGMVVGLQSAGLGIFAGLWAASRWQAPGNTGLQWTFLGIAGLFALFIGSTTIRYTYENEPPFKHSVAHVEIRLPAGATVPPKGPHGESYQRDKIDVSVLHGDQWRSLDFGDQWMRRDGERVVVMAKGWLGRSERPLAFNILIPGQPFRQFDVVLAPNPEPTNGFGDWQRVSSIRNSGEPQSQPPSASDDTEMRLRITRQK